MTSLKSETLFSLQSGLKSWRQVNIRLFKQIFSEDLTQKQLEEKAKLKTHFRFLGVFPF